MPGDQDSYRCDGNGFSIEQDVLTRGEIFDYTAATTVEMVIDTKDDNHVGGESDQHGKGGIETNQSKAGDEQENGQNDLAVPPDRRTQRLRI